MEAAALRRCRVRELAVFQLAVAPVVGEVYLSRNLRYNEGHEITEEGAECQAPDLPGSIFEAVREFVEAFRRGVTVVPSRLLRIESD